MRLHLDTLDIKDDLAMMMIGRPRRPRPSIWKVPRTPTFGNPRRSGLADQRGPLLSVSASALLYPPRGFWRLATKARRARRKPPPKTRNPLRASSSPHRCRARDPPPRRRTLAPRRPPSLLPRRRRRRRRPPGWRRAGCARRARSPPAPPTTR
jgi:hypothetical protein